MSNIENIPNRILIEYMRGCDHVSQVDVLPWNPCVLEHSFISLKTFYLYYNKLKMLNSDLPL